LWSVAPTTRGLIGDPRAAPALKDISAVHDCDEYEDQLFVILESVEVSHEPRIDPEDNSCRTKTMPGYAVSITSYNARGWGVQRSRVRTRCKTHRFGRRSLAGQDSSAGQQRLGHISKQGNALLRYLLGEAAQAVVRCDPDWRRRYVHLAMRRQKNIAKVAMARKLAVRLYWMWRKGWEYSQLVEFGSYAGKLATGHGVN
jgi:transposase IS116/IS110/IS902 family protein